RIALDGDDDILDVLSLDSRFWVWWFNTAYSSIGYGVLEVYGGYGISMFAVSGAASCAIYRTRGAGFAGGEWWKVVGVVVSGKKWRGWAGKAWRENKGSNSSSNRRL
nr:hypothetical protein [Tanacetum cinerariifolium]